VGWTSILEDNEKLRSHWEAVQTTLDTLRKWPEESQNSDPNHAHFRAGDLSKRVKRLMANFEEMLEELHQDALQRLSQPGVAIVRQIDKRTAQLDEKRDQLAEAKRHLAKARTDNDKLRTEMRTLLAEKKALEKEVATAKQKKADIQDWKAATGGMQPIRK
jgi:chromosome segregation ATPase